MNTVATMRFNKKPNSIVTAWILLYVDIINALPPYKIRYRPNDTTLIWRKVLLLADFGKCLLCGIRKPGIVGMSKFTILKFIGIQLGRQLNRILKLVSTNGSEVKRSTVVT